MLIFSSSLCQKTETLPPIPLANIYKYTTYWWGLNGITRLWRLLWWGTQPLPSLFHIMNPSVQWFPRSIQSINCGIHSRQRKINCYLQSQCSEITGFMRGWLSPLTQWFRSTHISLAGVNYDHPCPRMQREKKEPFAFFIGLLGHIERVPISKCTLRSLLLYSLLVSVPRWVWRFPWDSLFAAEAGGVGGNYPTELKEQLRNTQQHPLTPL